MATATVSRSNTSITFDIWEEGSQPAVMRDVGKPELQIMTVARGNPRSFDGFSALDIFTVIGQLTGDNAYKEAQTLAEQLIKPHSNGDALNLDLSDVTGLGSYEIAVAGENALQLGYPPGQKDWVSLQLQGTVVRSTVG